MTEFENNKRAEDAAEKPAAPAQPATVPPLQGTPTPPQFGWAVCGFFLGPIAILLAWLTNQSNFPQAKSEAVKFSLIGFLATFVIWVLLIVLFGVAACSALTYGPSYYSYY